MKDYYIFQSWHLSKNNFSICFENINQKKDIPIKWIKNIFLFWEISLNTSLINYLNKIWISLIFFDYYWNYTWILIWKNYRYNWKITELQVNLTKKEKLYLIRALIRSIENWYNWTNKICEKYKISIQTNENYLRMIEWDIWIEHYNEIKEICDNYWSWIVEFFNRTRHPPKDSANAIISMLNWLIYAKLITISTQLQINTSIWFYHSNSANKFALILDLSDIFKIHLQKFVFDKIKNKEVIFEESDFDSWVYLTNNWLKKIAKLYDDFIEQKYYSKKLRKVVSFWTIMKLELYKFTKYILEKEKIEFLNINKEYDLRIK